ncbi:proline--tRNA ligase, partial [candidate division FCPU426 bacterium]|nr:proline--tRNA ligase [candidate division FCPU426 bacterium]
AAMEMAEDVYRELQDAGVEVLLDDRDERAGVKFKDADLIGIPIRLTFGKGVSENKIELKQRGQQEAVMVPRGEIAERILALVTARAGND